ncbi:hypothetical protein V490_02378 [Pseudogymnoascus sp. VKM F-3557]|nr:hypothetical protein V490_02378 [Pseudogymnoascus sp. VKM F-3557]
MTKATPPRMIAIGNPQPTMYPAILNHTALYIAPTLIPATHPRQPNAPYLTTQPDKTSSWLPWWVLGCGALPSAAPSSTNKGARLGMGDSRHGGSTHNKGPFLCPDSRRLKLQTESKASSQLLAAV